MVNHRASQVETLVDVLEKLDPKLKALGVVESGSSMTCVVDGQDAVL